MTVYLNEVYFWNRFKIKQIFLYSAFFQQLDVFA